MGLSAPAEGFQPSFSEAKSTEQQGSSGKENMQCSKNGDPANSPVLQKSPVTPPEPPQQASESKALKSTQPVACHTNQKQVLSTAAVPNPPKSLEINVVPPGFQFQLTSSSGPGVTVPSPVPILLNGVQPYQVMAPSLLPLQMNGLQTCQVVSSLSLPLQTCQLMSPSSLGPQTCQVMPSSSVPLHRCQVMSSSSVPMQTCHVISPSTLPLQMSTLQSCTGSLLLAKATSVDLQKCSQNLQSDDNPSKQMMESQIWASQCPVSLAHHHVMSCASSSEDQFAASISAVQTPVCSVVPVPSLSPLSVAARQSHRAAGCSEEHTQNCGTITHTQPVVWNWHLKSPNDIPKKVAAGKEEVSKDGSSEMPKAVADKMDAVKDKLLACQGTSSAPVSAPGEEMSSTSGFGSIQAIPTSQLHPDTNNVNKGSDYKGDGSKESENKEKLAVNNYGVDGDNEIVWLNKVVKVIPYRDVNSAAVSLTSGGSRCSTQNLLGPQDGRVRGAASVAANAGDDDIIWLNRVVRVIPYRDGQVTRTGRRKLTGVIELDDDDEVEILNVESAKSTVLPAASSAGLFAFEGSQAQVSSAPKHIQGLSSADMNASSGTEACSVREDPAHFRSCDLQSCSSGSGQVTCATSSGASSSCGKGDSASSLESHPPPPASGLHGDADMQPGSQPHDSFMEDSNLGLSISEVKSVTPDYNPLHELSSEGFYRCGYLLGECNFSTQFGFVFAVHLQDSHTDSTTFTCVHCGKVETCCKDVMTHLQLHLDQSREMIHCEQKGCGYSCASPEEFLGHVVLNHQDVPHPTCWNCHASFTSVDPLVAHVKYNLLQMVHCIYCDAADTSVERILKHVDTHHAKKKRSYALKKIPLCHERTLNHERYDPSATADRPQPGNSLLIVSKNQEALSDTSDDLPNGLDEEGPLKTGVAESANCLNESDETGNCETSVFATFWTKDGMQQREAPVETEKHGPPAEKDKEGGLQNNDKLASGLSRSWKKQKTQDQETKHKKTRQKNNKSTSSATQPPSSPVKPASNASQTPSVSPKPTSNATQPPVSANPASNATQPLLSAKPTSSPRLSHSSKQEQLTEKKIKQKNDRDKFSFSPKLRDSTIQGKRVDIESADKKILLTSDRVCDKSSSGTKQTVSAQETVDQKVQQQTDKSALMVACSCSKEPKEIFEVQRYECTICKKFFAKKSEHSHHIGSLVVAKPAFSVAAGYMCENHFPRQLQQKSPDYSFRLTRQRLAQEQEDNVSSQTLQPYPSSSKSKVKSPTSTSSHALPELPVMQPRSCLDLRKTDGVTSLQAGSSNNSSGCAHKEMKFCCHCCPLTFTNRKQFFRHVHYHSLQQCFKCPLCSFVGTSRQDLAAHTWTTHSNLTNPAQNFKVQTVKKEEEECSCKEVRQNAPNALHSACRNMLGSIEKEVHSPPSESRITVGDKKDYSCLEGVKQDAPNALHSAGRKRLAKVEKDKGSPPRKGRMMMINRHRIRAPDIVPNPLVHSLNMKTVGGEPEKHVTTRGSVQVQDLQKDEAKIDPMGDDESQEVKQTDNCVIVSHSVKVDPVQPDNHYNMPVPFTKLNKLEKQKVLLTWLLNMSIANKAIHKNYLIAEDDIHLSSQNMPQGCLDENVNLNLVENFFTPEAWKFLHALVEIKREEPWLCKCCRKELKYQSIACDACLCWYHFQCASLRRKPRDEFWFCKSCMDTYNPASYLKRENEKS